MSFRERLFGPSCAAVGVPPSSGATYFCNALGRPSRYRTYCTEAPAIDDSKLDDRLRRRGRSEAADPNTADFGTPAGMPGFWVPRPNCRSGTRPEMLVSMQNPLRYGAVTNNYADLPYMLLPKAAAPPKPGFFDRFRSAPPLYSGARELSTSDADNYRFVDLSVPSKPTRLAGRRAQYRRPRPTPRPCVCSVSSV
jgi:hypothetical protein